MSDWKECRIGDICQTISDTYKGNSEYVVLINTSDVLEGKVLNHELSPNKNLPGQFKKTFRQNDILYSEIRPQNKRFAFIDFKPVDYVASTKLMVLRCDKNVILPEYFYFVISDKRFIAKLQLIAETRSGTFPQITFTELANQMFYLPPLEVQNKIVRLLSSIDSKIETNRKINARLEEMAQAIFKSWFIDFTPFGGQMPDDWEYKYVSDFPHEIETGRRPKGGVSGFTEGIPSIGAESIKGIGYYDYSKTKYIPIEYAETLKTGRIQDFDLLIYKDGGKPGYFIPNFSMMGLGFPFKKMFLNEHVFRLNFGSPELNIFAYFFFKTDNVMNYLNSVGGKAAIPGINQKNVEDIVVIDLNLPQIKKFGEIVLPMFKQILENCKESARLAELRDTLLPKLMSGEIKV